MPLPSVPIRISICDLIDLPLPRGAPARLSVSVRQLRQAAPAPATSTAPTVAAPAPANALQELLPGWIQVGGQIRGRLEGPSVSATTPMSVTITTGAGPPGHPGLPDGQLRFYVQAQDLRAWGYDNGAALSSYQNPVDLRKGYVDYRSNESRGVQCRLSEGHPGRAAPLRRFSGAFRRRPNRDFDNRSHTDHGSRAPWRWRRRRCAASRQS
jgi:hypothetical protein